MSFVYDNMAALTVAIASAIIVWLFGGTRGDMLTPVVPWLTVFLLEMLVFFPQRRGRETTYDARKRLWKGLKRDPLLWVSVGLMLLLAIPFANNGLCRYCDAQLIANGLRPEPKLPLLPFCVDRLDHLNVCWWFLLALSAALVVRHSLARRGKRFVVAAVVWNAMAVAVFGFLQTALGAPGPFWRTDVGTYYGTVSTFFATFGYPNMAGSYFVLAFGLSVAMWRDRRERLASAERERDISSTAPRRPRMFWKRNLYLIPAVVNFYAALCTLSRAAILLAVVSAAIYCYHAFATFLAPKHRADRVRIGVIVVAAFAALVSVTVHYLPANMQKEVDSIDTVKVLDRVSGRGNSSTDIAWKLWTRHKLFGCGGWGYRHFCRALMEPKEAKMAHMHPGAMNVHNDYLQFLAEHGIVGFALMVAVVVLLLVPVARTWRKLAVAARFLKGKAALPHPRQVFALPGSAFAVLVACLCPLLHAFGDCPLRSLAVLLDFFIALAALPGFLPREEQSARHHHHSSPTP